MSLIRLIFFISTIKFINSIVYNIKPDERGPLAWTAGVNCLKNYSKIYFTNQIFLTRTENILLTHTWNLTSPSAEIELEFIKDRNEDITNSHNYYYQRNYQIRIISDDKFNRIVKIETAKIPTDYYVIVTDTIEHFQNIFIKYVIRASAWNPSARFIILYNNIKVRKKSQEITKDIFEILHKYSVTNATLLYAINITSYKILLLNNYNPKACRQISIDNYGYCLNNGKIIKNTNFQPINHIIDDLRNCTYHLCARIAEPFVDEDCKNGIEINLILQIQKHLGFKLNSSCESDDRGIRDDNGTWTNLLGKLIDKSCDFLIGGFYPDNEVHHDFWVSDPYLDDRHTWFIALAKKMEPWKGLVMIFKLNTWEGFVIVLFISTLVWYCIGNILPEVNAHKSLSLTALHTLAVVLGFSVNNQPKLHTLRLFFMALALYGLNVTSLYTSKLISVFSNPRYDHQVKTIQEVIELGIPYGGAEDKMDWFKNEHDNYILQNYSTGSNFEPLIENLRLVRSGEEVLLLPQMFVIQSTEHKYIYEFPEKVFQSQLEIIMKKGFPLLQKFNTIIRNMRDYGLFNKINDDFIFNNTILNNIRTQDQENEENQIVLTTHHFSGAFAILIIGWIIAILVLIFEILAKYFIIGWLNRVFGFKIGEKMKKPQSRKYDDDKFNNNYFKNLRKNEIAINPIRFTPIERRRIIRKGKDLRKFH